MSQIRLYIDEDSMRKALVFGLRARNVDTLTAYEADMINHPGEEHLDTAFAARRTLFSYNTGDYCALHQGWIRQKRSHSGIIVAPQQQYSVGEEVRRIMRLISRITAEQMRNRLEFRSSWA
jgi:hypothetical protein